MATVFSGGTYVDFLFTPTNRYDMIKNVKEQLIIAGWTNVAQATSQGPGNAGTVTLTIASPCVVTFTSHGFLGNERVILQTSGALPTGLSINTVYFVKFIDANTFNLATTSGGANINTTGSQSGTHTLNAESMLLQTATQTNVTNPVRVRLKDNRGNCIQVSLENQAGTLVGANSTSNGGNLLPASDSWEIVATKYHFMVFKIGTWAARKFVMAGMLNIPSFITGITDHGYMLGDSTTDTDTNGVGNNACMRNGVSFGQGNNFGYFQFLWNAQLHDTGRQNVSTPGLGHILFTFWNKGSDTGGVANYRWANNDLLTSDVLFSIGLTSVIGDEAKIRGQFYDLVYIASNQSIDSTDSFSGHNWHNITSNTNINNSAIPTGGFWVATS